MITVEIGGEQQPLESATETWINQQINRRFQSGGPICVRVIIRTPEVNVVLSTPDCPPAAGAGGRAPNEPEARVMNLWEQRGMRRAHYTGGELISFLKQVQSYL